MFEKLYLIQNPLSGATDWISEREFSIGSQKLKDVFGVLYLSDVKFMLHYNIPFKESIMKKYSITNERKVAINYVCYMISYTELMELINKELALSSTGESVSLQSPAYPHSIELRDGCFLWNQEKERYDEVEMVK